ncbi:hypothetical protein AB0L13_33000, partial [Saccharopolyspora shandongensis]|uniref:hypothetical protein n=1 Tax=Saccharopolyspora shandongensis TaxID=418495 RepID=UPI003486C586
MLIEAARLLVDQAREVLGDAAGLAQQYLDSANTVLAVDEGATSDPVLDPDVETRRRGELVTVIAARMYLGDAETEPTGAAPADSTVDNELPADTLGENTRTVDGPYRAPHGIGQGRGSVEFHDEAATVRHIAEAIVTAVENRHRTLQPREAFLDKVISAIRAAISTPRRAPVSIEEFNEQAIEDLLGLNTGRSPKSALDGMLNGGLTVRVQVQTPLGVVEQDVVVRATLGPGAYQRTRRGIGHTALAPRHWFTRLTDGLFGWFPRLTAGLFVASSGPGILPHALNTGADVEVATEELADFNHDLRITLDAREGEFSREVVMEGAVDSAIAKAEALPALATDEPGRTESKSLRKARAGRGGAGIRPSAHIEATPAPAVELHRTLNRIFYPADPPRRNGRARPAAGAKNVRRVMDATTPDELWKHLREALSAKGYVIAGKGALSGLAVKVDLHDRKLLGSFAGPDGSTRYRVRATPTWDVTPAYKSESDNGMWSTTLRSEPDQPVELEVDEEGLADLGLAAVIADASTEGDTAGGPAADVLHGMPDYLVDAEGLGEAVQYRPVDGIKVETAFRSMLPPSQRVLTKPSPDGKTRPDGSAGRRRQKVKGLQHVQRAMENEVSSLLGDGRRFSVEIDGKPHELIVKAKFRWDEAHVIEGRPRWTYPPETRYRRFQEAHSEYSTDPSARLFAAMTAAPPMLGVVTLSGTTNVNRQTRRDVSEEHKRSSMVLDLDVRKSEAHVSYELELRDAGDSVVGRVRHGEQPRLRGKFQFGHPKAARSNTGPGLKPVAQAPPKDFALEELLIDTPEGSSFFDQVARMLPAHVTTVGTPGREALLDFLHRTNIKAELMGMVAADPVGSPDGGWRRSQPLFAGPDSPLADRLRNGSVVEMRAVPRQIEIIEETDAPYLLDWDNTKTARTDTKTAKRRGGFSVFYGLFMNLGPFLVTLGGALDFSHQRNFGSRFKRETGIRIEHDFTGRLVRYKTVYQLQVRVIGHPPVFLEGDLTGIQWATHERMLAAGIVGPAEPADHAPKYRSKDARARYAPAHLESGLSTAGAKIHEFRGRDRIYAAIADTLRKVPNHRLYHFSSSEFFKYFDDPDLAAGLKPLINDISRRQRTAKSRMSDKQLMQLVDRMLGPGLVIPLVKQGTFTDTVVTVRLKATMRDLVDGDLQIDVHNSTTETRTKEYETRAFPVNKTTSTGIGPQGRLSSVIKMGANILMTTVRLGRTWSRAIVVGNDTGKVTEHKHGNKFSSTGGQGETDLRHFKANLVIAPEVNSYTRSNRLLRRITLGRPGRHQLDVQPVRLAGEHRGLGLDNTQQVPVALLVPERLTTEAPPAELVVKPTGGEALPAGTLIDGLPKGDRLLEGADVLTVTGTEHVVDSAYRMLVRATGDEAFHDQVGSNAELIAEKLSPEAFRKDPRMFGRHTVEGLHHDRRRADTHARLGVTLKPIKPRKLGPEEYQRTKNTMVSGTQVAAAKDGQISIEPDVTNFSLLNTDAVQFEDDFKGSASGVFIFRFSPWIARWGSNRARALRGTAKTYFTPLPSKRFLISVGVEASVVAESLVRGNVDTFELRARKPVSSAGEKFELHDSVLLWVTQEQFDKLVEQDRAREVANQQSEITGVPTGTETVHSAGEALEEQEPRPVDDGPAGAGRKLPPPQSLGGATSLGIGAVDGNLDISDVLPQLRTQIAAALVPEAAEELLPHSPLTSAHNNARVVDEQLSAVDRMFATIMNGGSATPLRLEFRFSGRTYVFTMEGDWVAPLTEGRVEIVRKLAARNTVSIGETEQQQSGRNVLDVTAELRDQGELKQMQSSVVLGANPDAVVPSSGMLAQGVSARYVHVEQDYTGTSVKNSSVGSYGAIRGPVGVFDGDVQVTVKIVRKLGFDAESRSDVHDEEIAKVVVARPVEVRKIAEETFLPPDSRETLGNEHDIQVLPATAGKPEDLAKWRQDAEHSLPLPEPGDYAIEHYFGRIKTLRAAAKTALVESGVTVDTQIALAVDNAITLTTVQAGLPAMRTGRFSFPVAGLDRTVELHASLKPNPKLASASGRVEMDSFTGESENDSVGLRTGSTYSSALLVRGGGGTEHPPDAAKQEPFGSVQTIGVAERSGLSTRPDLVLDALATTESTTGRDPNATHRVTHPDLTTRGLLADVEFRAVAKNPGGGSKTGVAELAVGNAYLVRMRDAAAEKLVGKLPPALAKSVADLARVSKAWTDAVGAVETALATDPDADVAQLRAAVSEAETAWWAAKAQYHENLEAAQALERYSALDLARAQQTEEAEQRFQGVTGTVRPSTPPSFLAGLDHRDLAPDRQVSFFEAIDLGRPAPDRNTVVPASLAAQPDTVAGTVDRELVKAVHVPVLGGPVVDEMTWENLEITARTAREQGWTPVLLTDVSRELFVAARAVAPEPGTGTATGLDVIRDMDRRAHDLGFLVVNVDEIFNTESPMRAQDVFSAALDNETDADRDLARSILATEVLRRFGGVVAPGEYAVRDLSSLAASVDTATGFKIAAPAADTAPLVVAASQGNPFADFFEQELVRAARTGSAQTAVESAVAAATRIQDLSVAAGAEHRAAPEEPDRVPTKEDLDTLVGEVVETFARGLRARGDLDFAGVSRMLRDHPRGAVVFEAAVATLARKAAWRDAIRTVTLPVRADGDGAAKVSAEAEKWLAILPEARMTDRGLVARASFHRDLEHTDAEQISAPPTLRDLAAELAVRVQHSPEGWSAGPQPRGSISSADAEGTLDLALRIRAALHEDIDRARELRLDKVMSAAKQHEEPGLVLRAAVAAIAADTDRAGRVTVVVIPMEANSPAIELLDMLIFAEDQPGSRWFNAVLVPAPEQHAQFPGSRRSVAHDFDRGAAGPVNLDRLNTQAEQIADAILARHRAGLAMPVVVVEGGGPALGRARREATAAVLALAIDHSLEAAQKNLDPSTRIGRGQVRFGIAISDAPSPDEQVVVTVDGSRTAPEPVAPAAARRPRQVRFADEAEQHVVPVPEPSRTPAVRAELVVEFTDDGDLVDSPAIDEFFQHLGTTGAADLLVRGGGDQGEARRRAVVAALTTAMNQAPRSSSGRPIVTIDPAWVDGPVTVSIVPPTGREVVVRRDADLTSPSAGERRDGASGSLDMALMNYLTAHARLRTARGLGRDPVSLIVTGSEPGGRPGTVLFTEDDSEGVDVGTALETFERVELDLHAWGHTAAGDNSVSTFSSGGVVPDISGGSGVTAPVPDGRPAHWPANILDTRAWLEVAETLHDWHFSEEVLDRAGQIVAIYHGKREIDSANRTEHDVVYARIVDLVAYQLTIDLFSAGERNAVQLAICLRGAFGPQKINSDESGLAVYPAPEQEVFPALNEKGELSYFATGQLWRRPLTDRSGNILGVAFDDDTVMAGLQRHLEGPRRPYYWAINDNTPPDSIPPFADRLFVPAPQLKMHEWDESFTIVTHGNRPEVRFGVAEIALGEGDEPAIQRRKGVGGEVLARAVLSTPEFQAVASRGRLSTINLIICHAARDRDSGVAADFYQVMRRFFPSVVVNASTHPIGVLTEGDSSWLHVEDGGIVVAFGGSSPGQHPSLVDVLGALDSWGSKSEDLRKHYAAELPLFSVVDRVFAVYQALLPELGNYGVLSLVEMRELVEAGAGAGNTDLVWVAVLTALRRTPGVKPLNSVVAGRVDPGTGLYVEVAVPESAAVLLELGPTELGVGGYGFAFAKWANWTESATVAGQQGVPVQAVSMGAVGAEGGFAFGFVSASDVPGPTAGLLSPPAVPGLLGDELVLLRDESVTPNLAKQREGFPATAGEAWANYKKAYVALRESRGLPVGAAGPELGGVGPKSGRGTGTGVGLASVGLEFRRADAEVRRWGFDPADLADVEKNLAEEAHDAGIALDPVDSEELSAAQTAVDANEVWREREIEVEQALRALDDREKADAVDRAPYDEALRSAEADLERALARGAAAAASLTSAENQHQARMRALADEEKDIDRRFKEVVDLDSAKLDVLAGELDGVRAERSALTTGLAAARAEADEADARIDRLRARVDQAARDLAPFRERLDGLAAKVEDARRSAETAHTAWRNAELDLQRRIEEPDTVRPNPSVRSTVDLAGLPGDESSREANDSTAAEVRSPSGVVVSPERIEELRDKYKWERIALDDLSPEERAALIIEASDVVADFVRLPRFDEMAYTPADRNYQALYGLVVRSVAAKSLALRKGEPEAATRVTEVVEEIARMLDIRLTEGRMLRGGASRSGAASLPIGAGAPAPDIGSVEVVFESGVMRLREQPEDLQRVRSLAREVAAAAIRAAGAGRPLPRITITGYFVATSGDSAAEAMRARFRGVRRAFRKELGGALGDRSQHGISVDDIVIRDHVDRPETAAADYRRTVRIEVDEAPGATSSSTNIYRPWTEEAWNRAQIVYSERAAEFERRLAPALAQLDSVNQEVGKLVQMVWDDVPPQNRHRLLEGQWSLAGAVPLTLEHVEAVVRNGNIRERMRLLKSRARLGKSFFDKGVPRIPGHQQEREQRGANARYAQLRDILENDTLSPRVRNAALREFDDIVAELPRAHEVFPPLSAAERSVAVLPDGRVNWYTARVAKPIALDVADDETGLHRLGQRSGALVWTGTSGTAHLMVRVIEQVAARTNTSVDFGLLRLAMLATFIPAGAHTFHEVMRGFAFARPELEYHDNWGRYRTLHPLTEGFLRRHVAAGGKFPDEYAMEMLDWAQMRATISRPAVARLSGIDHLGDEHRFTAEQVRSIEFSAAGGSTLGVSFGDRSSAGAVADWGTSEGLHRTLRLGPGATPGRPGLWADIPSPWTYGSLANTRPFVVDLRGYDGHVSIQARNGDVRVEISTDTLASAVLGSDAFRRALAGTGTPLGSIVLLVDEGMGGGDSSSPAAAFAKSVRRTGFELSVWAPSTGVALSSPRSPLGLLPPAAVIRNGGEWMHTGRPIDTYQVWTELADPGAAPLPEHLRPVVQSVRNAADALRTMVRETGNLDLTSVSWAPGESARTASFHWIALIDHLSSDPEMRQRVRTVTDMGRDANGNWRVVRLPDAARVRIVVEGKGSWRRGPQDDVVSVTRPARLLEPGQPETTQVNFAGFKAPSVNAYFQYRPGYKVEVSPSMEALAEELEALGFKAPWVDAYFQYGGYKVEVRPSNELKALAEWLLEATIELGLDGFSPPATSIVGYSHATGTDPSTMSAERTGEGWAGVVRDYLRDLIAANAVRYAMDGTYPTINLWRIVPTSGITGVSLHDQSVQARATITAAVAPEPPREYLAEGSYPAVDPRLTRKWERTFNRARAVVDALPGVSRDHVLRSAADSMAPRHQAPPVARTGLTANEANYRWLYDQMLYVVADQLWLATVQRQSPEWGRNQAVTVSEELRKVFGTPRTREGFGAGTRPTDRPNMDVMSSGAGPSRTDVAMAEPDEGATAVGYPVVDPVMEARWASSFALARAAVDASPDSRDLIGLATRIMAARHQAPSHFKGTADAYRRVYEGITYVVANRLRLDEHRPDAERFANAREVSEELRVAFGSHRVRGGFGGAPALLRAADVDKVRMAAPLNEVRVRGSRGPVRLDVRRMEVFPGSWVREFSLRLSVEFGEEIGRDDQDMFWEDLLGGVAGLFNREIRLPRSGDPVRVQVIRGDERTGAHANVSVGLPGGSEPTSRTTWLIDESKDVLAQRVADLLGAFDDTAAKPWSGTSLTARQVAALEDLEVAGGLRSLPLTDLPAHSDEIWVSGRDVLGRDRRFTNDHVVRTPVLTSAGKAAGVLFTRMPGAAEWISLRQRWTAFFMMESGSGRAMPARLAGLDEASTLVFVFHGSQNIGKLEVDGIGDVRVQAIDFAESLIASGMLEDLPDGALVLLASCSTGGRAVGGFAHEVGRLLSTRKFKVRVAASTQIVQVHPPEGKAPPLVVIGRGGHLNVYGATTAADDRLVVTELVEALSLGWK